jgi:hypothetical protein
MAIRFTGYLMNLIISCDMCKITWTSRIIYKKKPNGLKMRRWICGWFYIYIHKSKNTSCQFGLSPPSNLLHQLFTIFIFYFIYIYITPHVSSVCLHLRIYPGLSIYIYIYIYSKKFLFWILLYFLLKKILI